MVAVPAPMAPLAGLLVLAGVVVVHELGHFCAARLQQIRVAEFSVGFVRAPLPATLIFGGTGAHHSRPSACLLFFQGPALLQRAPTEYEKPGFALRLLPLGGYVSFPRATNRTRLEERGLLAPGDTFDEVPNTPDLLENRPAREQALVIGAGVAANFVLAVRLRHSRKLALSLPRALAHGTAGRRTHSTWPDASARVD